MMQTYITALKNKVSMLQDRLVAGVCNTTMHNKLLQTADLMLAKCIDMCELSELKVDQLKAGHNHPAPQEIDYIVKTISGHNRDHNAPTTSRGTAVMITHRVHALWWAKSAWLARKSDISLKFSIASQKLSTMCALMSATLITPNRHKTQLRLADLFNGDIN